MFSECNIICFFIYIIVVVMKSFILTNFVYYNHYACSTEETFLQYCSCNFEAFASKLQEKCEEIFPIYCQ